MSTNVTSPQSLLRGLGPVAATAIVLANIIGTGIFLKTRVMTCNLGSPTAVMIVWIAAGLLSLCGALIYAELSTMMPRAGGEYNFLGAAYGRLWAFLFGWTKTVALGASVAAISIAFVIFLNDAVGNRLPAPALRLIPIGVIVVATTLNLYSVRSNGRIVTALSVLKVLLVLGVGAGGLLLAEGAWSHFSMGVTDGPCEGVAESTRGGLAGVSAAMLGALWGYNGWNIVATIGGEIRDPARSLPRALVGGTLIVIALYLLANVAYFYVLTPDEITAVSPSSSVARACIERFLGTGGATLLAAGMMLSAYGTLHTSLLTGSRLPFALARHGFLPSAMAVLSVRSVPVVAVVAVALWAIALTVTGTFDELTDLYIFLLWIFYGMTGTALFVLRRRHPEATRPFRVPGYPVVPALFLVVTAFLLVSTATASPWKALAGLGLVATGVPVYAYFARRSGDRRLSDQEWLGPGE